MKANRFNFRAWDGERMHALCLDGLYESAEHGLADNLPPLDLVTLMQSTGLTDANGVEIFEGDIVRGERQPPRGQSMVSRQYHGEIRYFDYFCQYRVQQRTYQTPSDPDKWTTPAFVTFYGNIAKAVVVIGNKYENPELLGDM